MNNSKINLTFLWNNNKSTLIVKQVYVLFVNVCIQIDGNLFCF